MRSWGRKRTLVAAEVNDSNAGLSRLSLPRLLLTQHLLAPAAGHLLQCSESPRTSRSITAKIVHSQLHFHCLHVVACFQRVAISVPKKGVVIFFPYFANAYENPVSTAWSAAKVLLRHFVSEKLGHEESLTAMKFEAGETKISWPNTPKHRCRSPLTSSIQNWFL